MFTKENCSKKCSNLQIEACDWLSCQHCSLHGFQILHFICYWCGCKFWLRLIPESRLTSFPSFCTPPSQVTVLFFLNLSRRPFLRQVVDSLGFRPAALHRIRFGTCYLNLSRRPSLRQVVDSLGFRPAALHRIQFGTCYFVPMSYFYSETNEW